MVHGGQRLSRRELIARMILCSSSYPAAAGRVASSKHLLLGPMGRVSAACQSDSPLQSRLPSTKCNCLHYARAGAIFFSVRFCLYAKLRSAYLSLLNGLCFTASLAAIIVRQLPDSFLELEINIYAIFTVGTWRLGYSLAAKCGLDYYHTKNRVLNNSEVCVKHHLNPHSL